jgi:hypothetical protein
MVRGAGDGAVLGLVRLVGVGDGGRLEGVGTPPLGGVEDGVITDGEMAAGDALRSADGLGAVDTGARPHAAPARMQTVKTASHTRLFEP